VAAVLLNCRPARVAAPVEPSATPETVTASAPPVERVPPRPMPKPMRAIWVARFHYRYADDVRTIIQNCAEAGFNTVLWQVRGEATVTYPSQIEPWPAEFDYRDPGFDPLAIAIDEAHRRGLRLEAWFNVLPGWKGPNPPPAGLREHVFYAHPDWFLYDANGKRQVLNKEYVVLNPCLPEVRKHIVSVVDEIVSRYDVDGVHLDYVRYAWDGSKNAKTSFPRDSRTLRLFQSDTGKRPDDDLNAWNNWRANQLTRLVSDIRALVNRRRPGATLTAAVWRDPRVGYNDYLQNAVVWLRSGLLDAAMPMAYTDKNDDMVRDVDAYRKTVSGRRVVPGVGLYLHKSPEQTRTQLLRCVDVGGDFALFSYDSLFPTAQDRQMKPKEQADAQRLRHMRRDVLEQFVPR
jgi:uncharacterized lipoprotein YddW (UPF0748 family)